MIDATLAEAFKHWANAVPDSPAVVTDDRGLSYRQLDQASDAIADDLRAAGLSPGDVAVLLLPRSAELIAASVAAAKAGVAYACVDPEALSGRLDKVLSRTRAKAVVTTSAYGSAADLGVRLIVVPQDICAGLDTRTPRPVRAGDHTGRGDVAVVIFTSGSTGEPRAVMIEHRELLAVIRDNGLRIGQGDTILLLAAVGFDASVFEMWAALANGAAIAVTPPGMITAAELWRRIERYEVTGMLITATLFRVFAEASPQARHKLRWVLVGGEEAPARQARRFAADTPGCALYNCYGPTETTVFATWFQVPPESCDERIPIGAPALGKRVYVLDEELRPCPDGVTGEIFIAGAGLARGYAHAPATTAERFVPDPAGGAGDRMYRTGDLGRLAGGLLDFVGRIDRQVKVGGYRVEPAEVERMLATHPDVAQAAVVAVRRPSGRQALCGYLVAARRAGISAGAVREWLRDRVPAYLVPSRLMVLSELPLTDNGKVDASALPLAWEKRPITDFAAVPPHGDLQERLTDLWSDVLGVGEIGITDNFFELGGDSLTAVEMLDAVGRSLDVELTARDLIENQSIAELAECLGRGDHDSRLTARHLAEKE